jgi:hypothetical protein
MPRANQMPIHGSRLPYSQHRILYSTLLANPVATMLLEQNPLFGNRPVVKKIDGAGLPETLLICPKSIGS